MKNIFYVFTAIMLIIFSSCSSDSSGGTSNSGLSGGYIADYTVAKEEVLRAIPIEYINSARNNLKIAYQHTSHGTHVSYGLYGLEDYKVDDDILFGVSNSAEANKLFFGDNVFGGPYGDLSTADANWSSWLTQMRTYLDDDTNDSINVVMWSWCDITGHSVTNYLTSAQTIINEYGQGGNKIGTGSGRTKTIPVTFIFMTGHANDEGNTGLGNPKSQAEIIVNYCRANNYFCLDYYSIDTHDMNDIYWEDAGDNGNSTAYNAVPGTSFYQDWQSSHALGVDWFYSKSSIGGANAPGQHNDDPVQYITANRKAYAMWWILARIAGWN